MIIKKFMTLFTSIVLVLVCSIPVLSAEGDNIISGLNEKLDELCLSSATNTGVRLKIQESYSEHLEYRVKEAMKNPDYAKEKMGVILGDADYEAEQLRYMFTLDMNKGFLITLLNTIEYSLQYAQEGCFEYLFDVEKEYWRAPLIRNGNGNTRTCYKINGERFDDGNDYPWIRSIALVSQYKIYNLIENREIIKNLLSERGETEVKEIKICALALSRTGLYIKCPKQEYFLKISDLGIEPHKCIDKDYFEFTTLAEATQAYEDFWHSRQETYVTPVKPTYQAEAESLQERGLLKGNEKGLDLLKPLTRIEAATMLLRAIGQSETTTHTTPAFFDVPITHWGFGAAENAFALGIINGIGNSLFAPDEAVTAEQFATMVLRAGHHSEFNWEDALDIMVNEGIISAEDASTMDFFARCDMAKIIYEAIEKGLF